jgi:hypothetical protein
MKKLIFLLPIAILAGCTSPVGKAVLSPAMVQVAVETGVSFGSSKYPAAVPYLRIADSVICSAADSTNIEPAQIVAAVEAAGVVSATNAEAVLILNGSLAIYETVFDAYGTNWIANQPVLQGYLKSVCDGISAGLPPAGMAASRRALKPHIR